MSWTDPSDAAAAVAAAVAAAPGASTPTSVLVTSMALFLFLARATFSWARRGRKSQHAAALVTLPNGLQVHSHQLGETPVSYTHLTLPTILRV